MRYTKLYTSASAYAELNWIFVPTETKTDT